MIRMLKEEYHDYVDLVFQLGYVESCLSQRKEGPLFLLADGSTGLVLEVQEKLQKGSFAQVEFGRLLDMLVSSCELAEMAELVLSSNLPAALLRQVPRFLCVDDIMQKLVNVFITLSLHDVSRTDLLTQLCDLLTRRFLDERPLSLEWLLTVATLLELICDNGISLRGTENIDDILKWVAARPILLHLVNATSKATSADLLNVVLSLLAKVLTVPLDGALGNAVHRLLLSQSSPLPLLQVHCSLVHNLLHHAAFTGSQPDFPDSTTYAPDHDLICTVFSQYVRSLSKPSKIEECCGLCASIAKCEDYQRDLLEGGIVSWCLSQSQFLKEDALVVQATATCITTLWRSTVDTLLSPVDPAFHTPTMISQMIPLFACPAQFDRWAIVRCLQEFLVSSDAKEQSILFTDTCVFQFLEGVKQLPMTKDNGCVILRFLGFLCRRFLLSV